MKLKLKAPISTSIAIAVGLIVIIGYFIDVPIFITLREVLLHWAIILAALALVIGIFNLIYVHIHKISSQSKGDVYSMILLISLILTVIITLVFSPTGEMPIWLFNYIVIPAEASLLALLAAILIYFCIRLFKRGVTLFSVIFVFTVLDHINGYSFPYWFPNSRFIRPEWYRCFIGSNTIGRWGAGYSDWCCVRSYCNWNKSYFRG